MSNIRSTACLLAFSLFVFSAPGKAAQAGVYAANDLLLFFQNPAGTTGTDKVVYFNLGSTINVFRNAATPDSSAFGSTIPLGNINTILTSTYGADWTGLSSSIFFGANGQNGSTSGTSTSTQNGDYARTVYITKARTSAGSVGQANSASPLYTPSQTAVAGQINGANNIDGMTQPGAVLADGTATTGSTLLDNYNPFSPTGAPATAYGAINGGLMGSVTNSSYTFGSVARVVSALDLYRVAKTSGTGTTSASIWHNTNNIAATYSNDFGMAGGGSAAAYYLGTITLGSDGSVNFVARQAEPEIALTGDLTGMTTTQGVASAHKDLTIEAKHIGTGDLTITLPTGFEVSTNGGTSYAATGTIAPTNGSVTATVRVRIAATATQGNLTGNVTVSAAGKDSTQPISGSFVPSVTISGALSAFVTIAGTASDTQSFNVSGINLSGALTVTAPSGFEVRRGEAGSFAPVLSIDPTNGSVGTTICQIRIAATTPTGPLNGSIRVESNGASSSTLAVDGTVNNPPSSLTVTANLDAFSTTAGSPSDAQQFDVSGSNLTDDVTVTAPSGFEISADGVAYSNFLTLLRGSGNSVSVKLSVRLAATDVEGPVSGSISVVTTGAQEEVNVVGSVGAGASIAVAANLKAFSTTKGTPSTAQTFTLSGANLADNITIAAPAGFEVSLDGSSYSPSQEVPASAGSVPSTVISVRIAASAPQGQLDDPITMSAGPASASIPVAGTVLPPPPSLSISGTLAPFSTFEGVASEPQTFNISGSNLTGNINLSAPLGFEISRDTTSYSASLALVPSEEGTVPPTTISVRVASSASPGSLDENISVASQGAPPETVPVSATVTALPRISVEGSLAPFNTVAGNASTAQVLVLSGSGLAGNVTVEVPQRFELSLGSGQEFVTGQVEIVPAEGVVSRNISFRLAAVGLGSYSGDLVFRSPGAAEIKVAVSGNAVAPPVVDATARLTTFNTTRGSASASQSFSITGENLTAPVTVAAPTGYEVSLDDNAFAPTQQIAPTNGAIAVQVYARIAATTEVGSPAGTISVSSAGAAERSITVSGRVVPPPSLVLGGTVSELSSKLGTASAGSIFTISGTDLTGNVAVSAPAGFEVTGQRKPYARSIVLTPQEGVLSVEVVVRIARTAALGNLSGNIAVTTEGVATQRLAVKGKVSAVPSISLRGSPKAFTTARGRPSASQVVRVSGTALKSVLSVTAPSGFQVSANGKNFASRVQFTPKGGALTNQRVWIRLASNSRARTPQGSVTASSSGAKTRIIRVSGWIR